MSSARPHIDDVARETAASWCARIAEGPLAPDERAAFQDWLDSECEHPALFERTVVAWEALEDQAGEPGMIRMRGEALDSLHRANARRWSVRRALWPQLAGLAAALLVAVATGLWWYLAPIAYETGIGERRVIALSDGSSLSLDAATRVDVRYRGDARELWLLHGRARFTVAHDPLRPFSVRAGDRLVVATGTQFSVESLADQMRVVLYEGHVSVFDASGGVRVPLPVALGRHRVSAEQALQPGRELVVATTAPLARLTQVDIPRSLAWEGGLMQFSDEPLTIAVQRMNRYGSVRLRTGDATAASTPISGQFTGGDTDAFVQGVTAVFPLIARREADGTIVLRSRSGGGNR